MRGWLSGCVVHGSVPVRCPGDPAGARRDARRRVRRHRILSHSELHTSTRLQRKTRLLSVVVF